MTELRCYLYKVDLPVNCGAVRLCFYVLTQLVGVFHLFSKLVILLSLLFDARHSANWAVRDVKYGRSNCTVFKLSFLEQSFIHCAAVLHDMFSLVHSLLGPASCFFASGSAGFWLSLPRLLLLFLGFVFFLIRHDCIYCLQTFKLYRNQWKHQRTWKKFLSVSWRHKKLFLSNICRENMTSVAEGD